MKCQDMKVLGSFFLGVAACKFSDLGLLLAEKDAKKAGGWGAGEGVTGNLKDS